MIYEFRACYNYLYLCVSTILIGYYITTIIYTTIILGDR